jgi:hypothetical protein
VMTFVIALRIRASTRLAGPRSMTKAAPTS